MGEDEVEAYLRHRLTLVDWQGNPDFDLAAIAAIHRHSGGIPRRVNQLAHRLMLHAAVEGAELLDRRGGRGGRRRNGRRCRGARAGARGEGVAACAPRGSARFRRPPRRRCPIRSLRAAIAALEARAEEHEAMLRRVLVLLVDWVEAGQDNSATAPTRPEREGRCSNALSVDVEDWFQVGAFETVIARATWEKLPARVERNTDDVLALFDEAGVKATFFTLGWIAQRHPALIRRIAAAGHEIASHGWDHKRVFTLSEAEFRDDLVRARKRDRGCGRADSRRLSRAELLGRPAHALGASGAGRAGLCLFLQRRADRARPLWLARGAALRLAAGGGRAPDRAAGHHLRAGRAALRGRGRRLLPAAALCALQLGDRAGERREGRPAIFYFHPWEIDTEHPRVPDAPLKSKLRHFTNLSVMRPKLLKLLKAHDWGRTDEVAAAEQARLQ